MRAPLSWIREYVDLPADVEVADLAHRLTALGLKLEALESPASDVEGPIVADLLRAGERLSFIVTSRAPLHLSSEQQVPVAPLAVPDPERPSTPERLAEYPAVELSYRANEPGRARVIRGWHGWTIFPILFTAAGTLVLACVVHIVTRGLIRDRADRRS
mgnify:CR=1 FL=1